MFDFNALLHWKLLAGSHKFPGPDGGTCINEAAIVAAGFAYREIGSPKDCPPCFSRPLSAYALALNDRIQDDTLRHALLMPFVTRLAGSADANEVEERRAGHIIGAILNRILPLAFEFRLSHLALICRTVESPGEARVAASTIVDVIDQLVWPDGDWPCVYDDPLLLMQDALRNLLLDESWGNVQSMLRAGDLVYYAGAILDRRKCGNFTRPDGAATKAAFAAAASILAEAIEIGKQAEPVPVTALASRFAVEK